MFKKISTVALFILILFGLMSLPFAIGDCFILQPFSQENISTTISNILSYYTLLATLFIALFIYYLQKHDEKREETQKIEQAKSAIAFEIEYALEYYFFMPTESRDNYMCEGILDAFNSYVGELKKILSKEELTYLRKLILLIKNKDDYEISAYLRPWIRNAYLSSDFQKYFCMAFDCLELLNKQLFSLLMKLKSESRHFCELEQILDVNGEVLFNKTKNGIKIISDNEVILDGSLGLSDKFNEPVVMSGYAKTDFYEGTFRNGLYDGEGSEFVDNHKLCNKGYFEKGKFKKGIMYDCVISVKRGQLIYKENCPDDPYDCTEDFEYEIEYQIGKEIIFKHFGFYEKEKYLVDVNDYTKRLENIRPYYSNDESDERS